MSNPSSTPFFYIGALPVYGDLILAPMDGISDSPFRSISRQLGSAISYTEFLNAIDIVHGHTKIKEQYRFEEQERPIAFQIFDNDPKRILNAALILERNEPDFIDINMGCSSISVSGRGAGAGLLKSTKKIIEIFSSLTKSLKTPVTGKIRLGWDEDNKNYLEVARIIEENYGKMIAVHARTRSQKFSGTADWDAIGEIKTAVKIPVIGNGDVKTVHDIEVIKHKTQCDAVMIGRASFGNPWIFSRMNRGQVPPELVYQTMMSHLEKNINFYGSERGIILFRKHMRWYLNPYNLPREYQAFLLTRLIHKEIDDHLRLIIFGK